jgi:hypothetical protein
VVSFPGGVGPDTTTGRTLVPVRGVFEHLGFTVDWEPGGLANTVEIHNATYTIRMTLDSATFYVNNAPAQLDIPATRIEGRTMIPIRLPLEAVGFNIDWDNDTRTVLIYN